MGYDADWRGGDLEVSMGGVPLREVVLANTYLNVACSKCDRRGRYAVRRLIDRYGGEYELPQLARDLSKDCERSNAFPNERCSVYFPGLESS